VQIAYNWGGSDSTSGNTIYLAITNE